MAGQEHQRQHSEGGPTAQAQDRSTAIVQENHYYEHVPPLPVDKKKVDAARRTLEGLPVGAVPRVVEELPHGSRPPSFGANEAFVGREDDLKSLAARLKADSANPQRAIAGVAGLSGVGKTQLASEFVYRYGRFFEGGVYWLNLADADNVKAEVAACGNSGSPEMGSDFPKLTLEDKVGRVTAAWQSALPQLLVFDNCEVVKLLAFWAPPVGGCPVLVTSRAKLEDASLDLELVELDILSREQSVELLRKLLDDIPADESALEGIADELGYHPLALDLAGRFLIRFQVTDRPHEYLKELREADPPTLSYHDSMEDPEGASPTNHELSVARTFELDLRRLDAADPTDGLALKILARAARLAPETPTPRPLLLSALKLPGGDRQAERIAERGVQKLTQLGLIRGGRDVQMHRLVSGVVVRAVEDGQAGPDVENAVADAVGPPAEAGDFQAVLPLLPHLKFLTNRIGEREDVLAGHLCFVFGALLMKLRRREDYGEALSYTERALAIMEATVGTVHLRTLRVLVNLGSIRHAAGDVDEALSVYRQALKVSKKLCGRRHPETAYAHNNLGSTLRDKAFEPGQTRYGTVRHLREAYRHYKRALKIRKSKLSRHQDLAESLTNMGHLMLDMRRFKEARGYLEQSLRVDSEPPVALDLRAKTLQLLGSLSLDKDATRKLARSFCNPSRHTRGRSVRTITCLKRQKI